MRRTAVVMLGAVATLLTQYIVDLSSPGSHRIATGLLGQTWYRIDWQDQHVGFMHNEGYRDHKGRWHFLTTTHFLMAENDPATLRKHLTFDAGTTGQLVSAKYTHRQNHQTLATTVHQARDGYTAQLNRNGETTSVDLDWAFSLADFLELESWLASGQPRTGEERASKSPDFERLRLNNRSYRLLASDESGYLLESGAPLAANRIHLDRHFRPKHLTMAGLFDITATDEADAIALKSLRRKTTYRFPVDQPLTDHTNLATLRLGIESDTPVLPQELYLEAGSTASVDNEQNHTGEELRYPITHQRIQTLVQEVIATETQPFNIATALVDVANRQLRYREDRPAGTVQEALATGSGECTDYADIYTTLARAAGLPAKTVYGLAYRDGSEPSFVFHAWNEVYVDGRWIAVDPTWNQTTIDASHVPLSDTQAAAFMLAHNTVGVQFKVLGHSYF